MKKKIKKKKTIIDPIIWDQPPTPVSYKKKLTANRKV